VIASSEAVKGDRAGGEPNPGRLSLRQRLFIRAVEVTVIALQARVEVMSDVGHATQQMLIRIACRYGPVVVMERKRLVSRMGRPDSQLLLPFTIVVTEDDEV